MYSLTPKLALRTRTPQPQKHRTCGSLSLDRRVHQTAVKSADKGGITLVMPWYVRGCPKPFVNMAPFAGTIGEEPRDLGPASIGHCRIDMKKEGKNHQVTALSRPKTRPMLALSVVRALAGCAVIGRDRVRDKTLPILNRASGVRGA